MKITRRRLLTGVAASLLAVTTERTLTELAEANTGPRLLWHDEFRTLSLASKKNPTGNWTIPAGYADFGAQGNQCWFANPAETLGGMRYNPFTVNDSTLVISAARTPAQALADAGNCPWLGGILISAASFGYGYYEFRMRLPLVGKGMFPALWLYAADHKNHGKLANAEIDLFEIFGGAGAPWHSSLHEPHHPELQPFTTRSVDVKGWHTYGVNWQPGVINFYYDRVRYGGVTGPRATFLNGAQLSIRMDFSMDALWFKPGDRADATTPPHLRMDIDYVRYYDRPF